MRLALKPVAIMLVAISGAAGLGSLQANAPSPEPGPKGPTDAWSAPPVAGLRFEECLQAEASMHASSDRLAALVPDAFTPVSTPPGVGTVQLTALVCDRIVAGTRILEEAALAWSSVIVKPTRADWGERGTSFYTLDLWTTPGLQNLLAEVGLEATTADFDALQAGELGSAATTRWVFSATDATIRLEFVAGRPRDSGADTDNGANAFHIWAAGDDFERRDVLPTSNAPLTLGNRVIPSLEGPMRLREALGPAPPLPTRSAWWEDTWDVSPTPLVFEA